MILKELIGLLEKIELSLDCVEVNRKEQIKKFQEVVWNDETIEDVVLNNILSTVAYDLDFYEPSKNLREESLSYYGDKRLREEINSALVKLKPYGKKA